MQPPPPTTSAFSHDPPTRQPHRRRRVGRRAGLVAAALILCAGCIGSNPAGQELRGKGDRNAPNREFLNGAVASNNAFAVDLLHQVSANRGNFAYSPYAILRILAMARAGSAGTTLAQFDATLHTNLATDLNGGINAVDAQLQSRTGDKRSEVTGTGMLASESRKGTINLEIAGSLWGQRGTRVKDDLLDTLATDYGTGFRVTDFRSDPETARQAVNRWASDATHEHIQELVPRGDITQYTRFLATAATFVQAPWQYPFNQKNTVPQPFYRLDDQASAVRMMQLTAPQGLRYAAAQDRWQAVEIPYLGDELVLDVVMPAPGQFDAFEKGLTTDQIKAIVSMLKEQPLLLRLPQFQFTTSANLNDTLSAQGLPVAFSQNADFSGVTTDEVLSLSEVAYQGFFGVDEDGSDAQPNTVDAQSDVSGPLAGLSTMTVDHPFFFFLRDRVTGLVFLTGRVVSPA